ncbi:hypothetical protein [uncultured Methylobacterium sp.]|uniref:hypothetical protein n=1 Tax=uncultured Methylobacterium sp. TaxID=157278 RepID=UPI002592DD50|nr:hypothetical protein [uncultured Methylobacterium sp.]
MSLFIRKCVTEAQILTGTPSDSGTCTRNRASSRRNFREGARTWTLPRVFFEMLIRRKAGGANHRPGGVTRMPAARAAIEDCGKFLIVLHFLQFGASARPSTSHGSRPGIPALVRHRVGSFTRSCTITWDDHQGF